MIPLRDNIHHYHKPIVTFSILILNVLVFLYELSLGAGLRDFIYAYGFIPRDVFAALPLAVKIKPLFTSMFLHAGFLHILGNMWFLWIFGGRVEDKLGHFDFSLFYILCGLAAEATHLVMNNSSRIPTLGASGAIAGVLGAYIVLFPRAKVRTLIPLFIFWEIMDVPAFVFLGIWFVYQFLLGMSSSAGYGSDIAFWAHIGGFLAGILFLKIFLKKKSIIRNRYPQKI